MAHATSLPLDGGESRRQVVGRQTSVVAPHRGYSLWIQVRGKGKVTAREGRFRLSAGEWIVIDRGLAVEAGSLEGGLMLGLVLGSDAVSLVGETGLLPGRGRMTRPQLREILRLWRIDSETEAREAVLARILTLEGSYESIIARCPGRTMRCKRRVFARMQRARQFLEGNRHRIVRLEELARLTSFSSWYLSKKFHEVYQESPQEASVRLRLEHARELLTETLWPIKRIAIDCGFDNCGSFGRAFRRMFKQTPTAFRHVARAEPLRQAQSVCVRIDNKAARIETVIDYARAA